MKKGTRILAVFSVVILTLVLFYFGFYQPFSVQLLPTPTAPVPVQAQNASSFQFCPGSVEIANDASASYVEGFNPVPVAPSVSIAGLGLGSIDSAMFSNLEQTEFNELLGAGSKYLTLTEVPQQMPGQVSAQVLEGIFKTDTVGNALSGLTFVSTPEGDLSGLASQNCVPFASEFWFLGGGTKIGQNLQLFVANRDDNPAEVKIEVWTNPVRSGPANTKTVQIARRSIQKILIAEISYDFDQVAIRVTSPQSKIGVAEQIHLLNGFESQGIDFIPSSTFATRHYFPKVSFNNSITTQFNLFSEIDSEVALIFHPYNSQSHSSIVISQPILANQPNAFIPNQSSSLIADGDYWVEIRSVQPFISNIFETYPIANLRANADSTQSDSTSSVSNQSDTSNNRLAELVVRSPSAPTNFGSVLFANRAHVETSGAETSGAETSVYLLNISEDNVQISIAYHNQAGLFVKNDTLSIQAHSAQSLAGATEQNWGFIVLQSLDSEQEFLVSSQYQSQLGITAVPLTPANPDSHNFSIIYLR
jgi:hypothetical protein